MTSSSAGAGARVEPGGGLVGEDRAPAARRRRAPRATRCCWPAESCSGRRARARRGRPAATHRAARAARSSRGDALQQRAPARRSRRRSAPAPDCRSRRRSRSCAAAAAARARRVSVVTSTPSIHTRPASGTSSAPIRVSSVVLPDPDGPATATSSPGRDAQRHVVDGAHVGVAAADSAWWRRRAAPPRCRSRRGLLARTAVGSVRAARESRIESAPPAPSRRPPSAERAYVAGSHTPRRVGNLASSAMPSPIRRVSSGRPSAAAERHDRATPAATTSINISSSSWVGCVPIAASTRVLAVPFEPGRERDPEGRGTPRWRRRRRATASSTPTSSPASSGRAARTLAAPASSAGRRR